MSNINGKPAFVALLLGHVAGMIDMAALPIWVGTLISAYGLPPSLAGGLVTLFLGGIVLASLAASVLLPRLQLKAVVPISYLFAALCLVAMMKFTQTGALAALHLAAGMATGMGLSATHAAMGKSLNPMKLFGWGGAALGVGAILFLGVSPLVIDAFGREMVFLLLASVIGLAGVVAIFAFPSLHIDRETHHGGARFGPRIWYAIIAILFMAMLQAMMFSFFERIGADRGFAQDKVRLMLLLVGVINMLPGVLAAMLQHRLPAMGVAICGAALQAVLGFAVASVTDVSAFMILALAFPPMMLFAHTFVFGYLSRLDRSGRAVAATPAMIMSGSAVGPLLGGIIVETSGYGGLSVAALAIGVITVTGFALSARAGRREAANEAGAQGAV